MLLLARKSKLEDVKKPSKDRYWVLIGLDTSAPVQTLTGWRSWAAGLQTATKSSLIIIACVELALVWEEEQDVETACNVR